LPPVVEPPVGAQVLVSLQSELLEQLSATIVSVSAIVEVKRK
jgi:hypothetical protein